MFKWFWTMFSLGAPDKMKLEKTTHISRRHHWFPAKWRLRNERRNSILMTCHYPDLGNDTSSVQLRCYEGKPVVVSQNVGGFLNNLLTVKMENAMNTRNTVIIAGFILKWSVNVN